MTNRSVLKSIDIISGVSENEFKDPDIFFIRIEVEIGLAESNGADVFSFDVCSPKWIENNVSDTLPGYGLLIMKDFDIRDVETWVRSVSEFSFDCSWNEAAMKISKYLRWEFDNYQQ